MALASPTPDTSRSAVTVHPLSIHTGAEIRGVDLTQPLSSEEIQDIQDALVTWKVVFFREQFLNHPQHIDFARQFGEATPAHVVFGGHEEYPEIYSIAKFRVANSRTRHREPLLRPWSGWHADITAAINPPAASILRGDVVPPYGGDTQWTNLAAAYQALSPTLRAFLDGLRGLHRFLAPTGEQNSYDEDVARNNLVSHHPLVRVHPVSGERVLYVSPSFLQLIVGLKPRESELLLELLWEHAVRPEFTVRFKWEPGSIAFWDHRSTAHLAPRDIFDADFDRQFWRITLMGEVPVGVDGRPSESIEGAPIVPQVPVA